jgi:hypothetical protein
MPNFTPEEISSEELDDLVNYILTIENFDLGLYDGERLQRVIGEEVILRHWMILTALEVEDTETAIGHVEFILEYVEDEHQEHMEEVLALLESGENHDAQHIVETMIADVGDVDGSESTFHLRLLVSAVRAEDYEEAHHHYEHYMSLDDHDADIAELLNVLFEGENYDEIVILLDGIIVDAEIEADEESHDDEHNHDDHSHEDDRQD